MKTDKKLKIVAILLFIIVLIFASIFGVYKKEDFRAINIIKKYQLGMQFTDTIVFKGIAGDVIDDIVEYDYESDETEEENTEDEEENAKQKLSVKDYKLAKKIIEKRLRKMGIGEYKIDLNQETGAIAIRMQNSDEAKEASEHALKKGEFKIIDKDTEEVLLNRDSVKSVKVVYGSSKTDTNTTIIYLQINFNKEGAKKLEEISQIYVAADTNKDGDEEEALEDETKTEEETEEAEEESTKYISVLLDDETLSSTYFGEKMSTGVLYIPITQAQDTKTLEMYSKEVNSICTLINSGVLPIEYTFTNSVEEANINQKGIIIGIAIPAVILLIACIVLIVKFKVNGLVSMFLQVGYLALLLLAIRYTNVIVTISTIIGIVLFTFINYVFNFMMLKNLKEHEKIEMNMVGKFALYTCPIYVIAIILSFNSLTIINSFGMAAVWGSICMYTYNLTITKSVLELLNK